MKKVLGLSLSALMVAGLAGCSNEPALSSDYTYVYSTDLDNMDYTYTDKATDHDHNVNFVEGLLENDSFGNFVGAAATKWESNDDATVWTFKIREGVKWMTATGDEYADVTAHDWVTGLHHAADFDSKTVTLVQGIIENLDAYMNGEASWEEVGVKAIDDYTLEYRLSESVPYFYTMATYTILYPINEEFLLSKGTGCALGRENADRQTCKFGAVQPDSILYSGPFVLSTVDAKAKISYTKNQNYWDAGNVFVDNVNLIYYEASDPYGIMQGYENGNYVAAPLRGDWADYDDYVEKYKDYLTLALPNPYAFGIIFNFNRVSSEHTEKSDAELAASHEALLNKNVRLAIQAGFDRVAYLSQRVSEEVALQNLRNFNGVPRLVTTSDGKAYVELVEAAYKELTGEEKDLDDGQDPFYNPDKAKEYIAKAEADGIKFPIYLDLPTAEDDGEIWKNQAKSMADSISKATDGKIVIRPTYMPMEEVEKLCYFAETPADTDYDLNTQTAWGPDYQDPKTFVDIFNVHDGAFNHLNGFYPQGRDAASDAASKAAGYDKYQELADAADAIKGDNDARYAAYAKADAYLLAEGLWIPMQMQTRSYRVSKVVPFTAPYSVSGNGGSKLKYVKVQVEPVTAEAYNKAKAEWEKGSN